MADVVNLILSLTIIAIILVFEAAVNSTKIAKFIVLKNYMKLQQNQYETNNSCEKRYSYSTYHLQFYVYKQGF